MIRRLGGLVETPRDLRLRGPLRLQVLVQKPEMYNPRAEMTREMYRESAPLATSAEEMVASEAAGAAAAA